MCPQVETATQTRQETYDTALNGTYTINSKMSLDLAANQNFVSPTNLKVYREWSTLDWLNYQFLGPVRRGARRRAGLRRHGCRARTCFSNNIRGGSNGGQRTRSAFKFMADVEDRQFFDSSLSDALNPVFGGGIQYQPFEHTKISLNAERVVAVSALAESNVRKHRFDGDLNQRLLGKIVSGFQWRLPKHQIRQFGQSTRAANRTDDYYYFNTRFSTAFLKRGTVAVFYQLSNDSSSQSGFSFTSHQVGFEIGFAY